MLRPSNSKCLRANGRNLQSHQIIFTIPIDNSKINSSSRIEPSINIIIKVNLGIIITQPKTIILNPIINLIKREEAASAVRHSTSVTIIKTNNKMNGVFKIKSSW